MSWTGALRRAGGGTGRAVAGNVVARVVASAALALSTVAVSRLGGPTLVGQFVLLRVLTGIVAVVAVAGLPSALAWLLAGPGGRSPSLWPTVTFLTVAGGLLGAGVWLVAVPVLGHTLLAGVSGPVLVATAVTVPTQLALTIGKTALQALADRRGSDVVIAAEEGVLPPLLVACALGGLRGPVLLVVALAAADLVVAAGAWMRVVRKSPERLGTSVRFGRPEWPLARRVLAFGARGQVGGAVQLLNLRLDSAVLAALAGPAAVGVYAVASKYAEMLRVPGVAATWVLYPTVAADDAAAATKRLRHLLPRAGIMGVVLAIPLALCLPVLPWLLGPGFAGAHLPVLVLLVGLAGEPAAGVAIGYLYGRGRPGRASLATGAGLVLTLVLDLVLVPRWQATGAAVASTVAYLTTDAIVIVAALRAARQRAGHASSKVSVTGQATTPSLPLGSQP